MILNSKSLSSAPCCPKVNSLSRSQLNKLACLYKLPFWFLAQLKAWKRTNGFSSITITLPLMIAKSINIYPRVQRARIFWEIHEIQRENFTLICWYPSAIKCLYFCLFSAKITAIDILGYCIQPALTHKSPKFLRPRLVPHYFGGAGSYHGRMDKVSLPY